MSAIQDATTQPSDQVDVTPAADRDAVVEGWQPIETAPKDRKFLALMHDGREPPNHYHEIIRWNGYGGDKGNWMNNDGSEYHEDAEAKGYCRPLLWSPLLPITPLPPPERKP